MKAKKLLAPLILFAVSCSDTDRSKDSDMKDDSSGQTTTASSAGSTKGTYAYDAAFLKQHTGKVIELTDESGKARVLLSADYQGRVMTSTASGNEGNSYGWLNYNLISSGEKKKQFNPVGGEERFWLGPEGGQYSIYFKGKDSFSFPNWQVPPIIDTISYEIAGQSAQSASFTKTASLTNYSGTNFQIAITREINLLPQATIAGELNVELDPAVSVVAYSTNNAIKNVGPNNWTKQTGLLSIWLLAMLTPSDDTKVIIPFNGGRQGAQSITKDYFGSIPAERLIINDSFLVLTCDGKYRSKIGLSPEIAQPVAGSYDFKRNILTITKFSVDRAGSYVNSKWELQKQPYKGDAVNAYNDGPLADGSQMGPFYEIESSSSAKELKAGETQSYKQTTFHFEGPYEKLETLALKVLGIKLSDVKGS